jgi:hypothetical protein
MRQPNVDRLAIRQVSCTIIKRLKMDYIYEAVDLAIDIIDYVTGIGNM